MTALAAPRSRATNLTTTAATAAAFAGAIALGGCQSSTGTAGCALTRAVPVAATPLTLLRDARLDAVGDGFVLIGADGTTTLRWARLSQGGALGSEQSVPLPATLVPPIFALAQAATPADTVLVGLLTVAANGADAELHFIAAPADGSVVPPLGPPALTFPAAADSPPVLAMATSRTGVLADFAWVDPASSAVMLATVDGQGTVGAPVRLDQAMTFGCLRFTAGAGDPAIGFLHYDDVGGVPTWIKGELQPGGGYTVLRLKPAHASTTMGCVTGTPSGANYAMGWQDGVGSWLGVYDPPAAGSTSQGTLTDARFSSATDFGGAQLQPPIVGLAPFGTDYGVAVQQTAAIELWRLDPSGNRRPGTLVFPSTAGNLGNASSAQVDGSLWVTYADYAASSGTGGSGGSSQRWLVDAACY